jgi:hypothetical protein
MNGYIVQLAPLHFHRQSTDNIEINLLVKAVGFPHNPMHYYNYNRIYYNTLTIVPIRMT